MDALERGLTLVGVCLLLIVIGTNKMKQNLENQGHGAAIARMQKLAEHNGAGHFVTTVDKDGKETVSFVWNSYSVSEGK